MESRHFNKMFELMLINNYKNSVFKSEHCGFYMKVNKCLVLDIDNYLCLYICMDVFKLVCVIVFLDFTEHVY